MPDENSFLAAILEHPEDDGPRLVFADWLEEWGDCDRADFIRVQCELAAPDLLPSRRLELQQLESELLRVHKSEWLAPIHLRLAEERKSLPPPPLHTHAFRVFQQFFSAGSTHQFEIPVRSRETLSAQREMWESLFRAMIDPQQFRATGRLHPCFEFRRGFIERVQMPAGELAAHADTIFSMLPIRVASVQDGPFGGGFSNLFACSHLERLSTLELRGLLGSDILASLAACPHLSRLQKLVIQGISISLEDGTTIGRLTNVGNLKNLTVCELQFGDRLADALAENEHWRRLEVLNLSSTGLTDAGLESLARSTHLENLRSLNVSSNPITGNGIRLLASSQQLPRLTDFDLSGCLLGDSVVRSLNRWVTRLIGDRTPSPWVATLIDSPLGRRLQRLRLTSAKLNPIDRLTLEERYSQINQPAV